MVKAEHCVPGGALETVAPRGTTGVMAGDITAPIRASVTVHCADPNDVPLLAAKPENRTTIIPPMQLVEVGPSSNDMANHVPLALGADDKHEDDTPAANDPAVVHLG